MIKREREKNMKAGKKIAFVMAMALLLVFLLNPAWNPLLDDGSKNAVASELKSAFGSLAGGPATGIFSWAKLTTALAVLVFTSLLTSVICLLLDLASRKKGRSQSLAGMLTSLTRVVGTLVGLVWVLSTLGLNLGAIFASLGVVSLIVGFGVQSLIEDCVTGIFIILENQYNIGDIIVVDDFRGTVRRISIRTTTIEDDGGNLKIINNSDIRNVQNRSYANSIATVNVGISYDADLVAVEKLIREELPRVYEENKALLLSCPVYCGVQNLADSAVELRIKAEVAEGSIYSAQRLLLREMKLILDKGGVEIPFPQVVVHNAK